jgi:antitoxin ParD1/3/4
MKTTTMNISMPEPLKAFVEAQVSENHYSGTSEYIRELVRRDQMEKRQLEQDRQVMNDLLMEGIQSPLSHQDQKDFIASLRKRAQERRAQRAVEVEAEHLLESH